MCAFRCGGTRHALRSNTHLQSFACTGGDDAAILPLSVRPFGCRTCGGCNNSCRYQGDDLGGVFQCVRGSWSRVRKVDRTQAHHYARTLSWRFTGGDTDAPHARRGSRRSDHGWDWRRSPGPARHDSPRQPHAARGVVHRHGGSSGSAQARHQHGRGDAKDTPRREIHRLFG